MNKIKCVSFLFKTIFQASFIGIIAIQTLGWIYAPTPGSVMNVIPSMYFAHLPATLTPDVRIIGFVVTLIPMLLELLVFWNLINLFKHYQRHEIFTADAVRRIRNAGYALLVYELMTPLFDFVLGFILTAKNPPGFRVAIASFSDGNIKVILMAFIIILISWVMTEGCQLQEEQQLTI